MEDGPTQPPQDSSSTSPQACTASEPLLQHLVSLCDLLQPHNPSLRCEVLNSAAASLGEGLLQGGRQLRDQLAGTASHSPGTPSLEAAVDHAGMQICILADVMRCASRQGWQPQTGLAATSTAVGMLIRHRYAAASSNHLWLIGRGNGSQANACKGMPAVEQLKSLFGGQGGGLGSPGAADSTSCFFVQKRQAGIFEGCQWQSGC